MKVKLSDKWRENNLGWEKHIDTEVKITPLRGTYQVNTQDSLVSLNQGGNHRVLYPVRPWDGQVCSRMMTL